MSKNKDVQPVNRPAPPKPLAEVENKKVNQLQESLKPSADPVLTEPVYNNISLLVWPTDPWGLTKEFKAAVIQIASKINGHEDKKELFDATLEVALKHIGAKYEEQKAQYESLAEVAKASE